MINRERDIVAPAKTESGLFYGFIIAVAAFFILFSAYGVRFAYGVFFKPMAKDLGFSAATTSAAYSISFFCEGIFSLVSGGLADRFGPRIVVSLSSILVVTGYCLTALVHSPWQLFLYYGILIGVGMGAMFVPLVSMTARWFNARRNLMTGLVSSGAGVGMLCIPPYTAHLIDGRGWRNSFVIMGVFIFVVAIIAAQFFRRDPASMGAVPYGESRHTFEHKSQAQGHSYKEALRAPQFWIFFALVFCFGMVSMSYNVHIVPDAINSGMRPALAADIMAVTGAMFVISRVVLGTLADRHGNKPVLIFCFIVAAAAFFFITVVHVHWAFFLLALLIGITQGGVGTSQSPVVASLFGLRSHGLILGSIGLGSTMGSALGPLLAGYIFDFTGSYHWALFMCAIFSLLALVFAGFIRPSH
jgi:MFS family permease